jgi:hypothetical protein
MAVPLGPMIEDFNQPTHKFDFMPGVLRLHAAAVNAPGGGPIMSKVVCVLYDDPVGGMPKTYARDTIPHIERYPGGQTAPTPKQIDFQPSELLGCVSGELGLRKYLESQGHKLVVTSDKDGPNSVFERELAGTEIVISQPFWPAYLTGREGARHASHGLAREGQPWANRERTTCA